MSARELPVIKTHKRLRAAAAGRERVRIRGRVAERGDGYSETFRNVWLRIETADASVRVTATPKSPLGTLEVGSAVEVAARLTGMVDVADNVYLAERAQLLTWAAGIIPQANG